MRSSARSVLPAVLTFFWFAAPLFAQSPAKQQPAKTPRGSVSGRVTIKGKPAPGVVVGLRKDAIESAYDPYSKAVTDAEGIYRITNVSAGAYVITIAAPAYVPSNFGDRKSVVLTEDENVEGINFSLVRGGVITGKVTHADGRPVIQHQIEIYTLAALDRRGPEQPPFPTMNGQTDDRGIYRVFGIAPGRYKVAAGRGNEGYAGFSPSQPNYKQVFHPDADDPAKATVIEVSEGSEAKDIDITLGRAVQTFSVSGRIINSETNGPVPNLRFSLQRLLGPRVEFVNTVAASNARGEFIVEGLIPGKYSTVLFQSEGSDLRAEPTTFEIVDQDVSDVTVKLSRGASVSGLVVLESEDKSAARKLTEMFVRGYVPVAPGSGYGNAVSSSIAPDGTFRLAGLANGIVNIALSGTGSPYPPKGFSIVRIERDGMPAPRIEIKEAEQVTGVKIVIGYGTATLRGVVKLENGPLPPGARVFVRLTNPGETVNHIRPPVVDQRGNFLIEGVPAGQYEITASVFGGNIKPPKPIKQDVSLANGVVTDVTIIVDLATPSNP